MIDKRRREELKQKIEWRNSMNRRIAELEEELAECRAYDWIAVDEALPELGELIELYMPAEPSTGDELVTCGHRDKYGWTYVIALSYPGSGGRPWFGATTDAATHWRKLPPPPPLPDAT